MADTASREKPYATEQAVTLIGDPAAHVHVTQVSTGWTGLHLGPATLSAPSAAQLLSWLTEAVAAVEKAEKRRVLAATQRRLPEAS